MPKVVFELNRAGVAELLRSSEMREAINAAARSVANNAAGMASGAEYEVEVGFFKDRVSAKVSPANGKATDSMYKNNSLEKALRGTKV